MNSKKSDPKIKDLFAQQSPKVKYLSVAFVATFVFIGMMIMTRSVFVSAAGVAGSLMGMLYVKLSK